MSDNRVCKREFYVNLLVIDTHEFDVISGMNWVITFHIVIDCWMNNFVFQISDYLEFEFIGDNNIVEPTEFTVHPIKGVLAHLDVIPTDIPVVLKFIGVFVDFFEITTRHDSRIHY